MDNLAKEIIKKEEETIVTVEIEEEKEISKTVEEKTLTRKLSKKGGTQYVNA